MASRRPRVPPPPPLRGSDPDSFARHTVTSRLPAIVQQALEAGSFPAAVERGLADLRDGLPDAPLPRLDDDEASDAGAWARWMAPYRDETWLSAPWFATETYLYRRIASITGFFSGPLTGRDPFRPQKQESRQADRTAIRTRLHAATAARDSAGRDAALHAALTAALWGNQADLSMWPDGATPDASADPSAGDDRLLADDRRAAVRWIAARAPLRRVDVLLDNVGLELATDLALAWLLLDAGAAEAVHLHVKPHPLFVSDALAADLDGLLDRLAEDEDSGARIAGDLEAARSNGTVRVRPHRFWTSPLAGWEMPAGLQKDLGASALVISKGDANYRRWLGDRHWSPTTALGDALAYRPAPVLLLRTLKSEVAAGLAPQAVARARAADPDWMVSGTWGLVQLVP